MNDPAGDRCRLSAYRYLQRRSAGGTLIEVDGREGIQKKLVAEIAAEANSRKGEGILLKGDHCDADGRAISIPDRAELDHAHKAVHRGYRVGLEAGDEGYTPTAHQPPGDQCNQQYGYGTAAAVGKPYKAPHGTTSYIKDTLPHPGSLADKTHSEAG